MQIILKNDYGELTIGVNGGARLLDITGLGIPEKETQTVSYSGQPGQTTLSMRDMPRAITMKIDFKGSQDEIIKLYRMIYYKVNIIIVSGEQERTIQGLCVNPSDIERIIYHKMYSIALQFICDDPYFHDLSDTNIILFDRIDNFPNVIEDGYGYISLPAVATTRMPGKQKLNNKGVVKVYPVIEINNATNETTSSTTIGIIINNYTTGVSITIERDMKPGETIIIDLPHRKITSDIDGNIINFISDDTVLSNFYFDVGMNEIEVINKNTLQFTQSIIKYNNNYEAVAI